MPTERHANVPAGGSGQTAKSLRLAARTLSTRYRVVGWLMLLMAFYRLGLPVLYAAALAALPWLLTSEP